MANNQDQGNMPPVQPPFAGYPPGFHTSLLNEIPKYEGTPSELSEYIRAVEDIFSQFWQIQNPAAYINKLLLSAARNRLKGAALEVVTGHFINSWIELKQLLIDNFGDQRSELNLKIDISRLRQNSRESPIDYFNRCRSLLAILNSKISLGNEAQIIREHKLIEARNLTLTAFISGLLEPLGSFIRSRAPQTLENALTYVKSELDIRYFQNLNQKVPQQQQQQHFKQTMNQFPSKPQQNFQRQPTQNYYPQQPSFQQAQYKSNPLPIYKLNPNVPPQTFPGFQPKYGKPGQNVFRPQRNFQPTYKPEPMDASTIKKRPASQQLGRQQFPRPNFQNNFRPTNFIQQSNQPRNFHSQELHHSELHDSADTNIEFPQNEYQNIDFEHQACGYEYAQPEYSNPENYDEEPENDNYFDNENFRIAASD